MVWLPCRRNCGAIETFQVVKENYYEKLGQIKHPIGMHKPLNRVGDAYGWLYVRYSLLQPIVGRFIQPEWR